MKIAVGAKTDVGRLRHRNEDSYVAEPPVFGVADGMGGHVAGDVASSTAVEIIKNETSGSPHETSSLAEVLESVNLAIFERSASDASLRGMGTTCTLMSLVNGEAHLAHVGDSRAYLYRAGELKQLTEDHTLVGRMVKEGRLTPEEAEHHPHRSMLTRTLGVDSHVDVDTMTVPLAEGDRILLCSDGLSSMIHSDDIVDVLDRIDDPQAAADALVDLANDAGGDDNITVVLVDVGTGEARAPDKPATRPAPERSKVAPRRTYMKWVAVGLGVVLLGVLAARYALSNSWFVGVNENGFVTVYRGIPEEIAGFSFRDSTDETDLALQDIPDFKQGDVEEGIRVDSEQEAEEIVDNLRTLSEKAEPPPTPAPSPSPKDNRRPDKRGNRQ